MDRRKLIGGALLLPLAGMAAAKTQVVESKCCDCGMMDNIPREIEDSNPLDNELEKYPRCVLCNMDRSRFHATRHLLHYGDNTVHATCSITCAAQCMVKERRRKFKKIYAADFGSGNDIKPLTDAKNATYLLGSNLPRVMSPVSKHAFSDPAAAEAARKTHGGEIADFAAASEQAIAETARYVINNLL
ncbi:MAG: nitrous oxide reductase accessory protein NosL [Neisseria sp.]|nr:nitrous oxide reductase accessory protein NosL [Neisseria sp.]